MLMTTASAWALSALVATSALAQTDTVDRNLGRQPDGIVTLEGGSTLKLLTDMPRGATGPWRYLLTIDSTRTTDTGQRDEAGNDVGKFAYRRVSHVALLVETRPESIEGDKRTYTLTLEQVAVDNATSFDGDGQTLLNLPAPTGPVAPPLEGEVSFARIVPNTMGIRGTLVMDREGWIDALTFDWGEDPDDDAVTLCLDLERVLQGLMPPMPAQPVGDDATWRWSETQAVDGVLTPVSRTIKADVLAGMANMPKTTTFNQTWTALHEGFEADPVSLAFANADVSGKSLTVAGSGASTWYLTDEASPLPRESTMSINIASRSTWRPKDKPDADLIDAKMSEKIAWTVRELSEPLPVFPDQDSTLPEYDADPLAIDSPTNFDQAVGFMERQLADLDLALQPGGAEARAQAGEGEPLNVSLPIAVGTPLRAKLLVEEMTQQESQLATIDEITAFRVDAEITATIEKQDPQLGWRGTLTIDKASGIWLEKLAVGEPERVIAPQPALATFVGKPIPFSITSLGMVVVETNDLEFATELDFRYILTAIADGFKQVQVERPFDPMRMGQTTVLAIGAEDPQGVRDVKTLTLEGAAPRVLRQVGTLRAQIREKDLFTLTPVIVDARVATTYYHHLVIEDADTWLPARARRRDIHRTTATYEREGQPGTGQKLLMRAVVFDRLD